jgi:hypothetical protein
MSTGEPVIKFSNEESKAQIRNKIAQNLVNLIDLTRSSIKSSESSNLFKTCFKNFVANDPIIESSGNLTFAPYNVAYPLLDKQAASVGFDTTVNKWDLIFDFTKGETKDNYQFLDPS